MTKWHKEIALLLTNAENTEKMTDLYTKTSNLLSNLKSFAEASPTEEGQSMVTLDALRAKKLPAAMENFLFNLAVAENIMML